MTPSASPASSISGAKTLRTRACRAASSIVMPWRRRSCSSFAAYAGQTSAWFVLMKSIFSIGSSSSRASFSISCSRASRIGRQIPSSARILAARRTLGCSPSGKTMRLGSRRAFSRTTLMTSLERESIASSRRRYAPMSVIGSRATPERMAASATAGATQRSTRGSKGFGIRYSRPNRNDWPP